MGHTLKPKRDSRSEIEQEGNRKRKCIMKRAESRQVMMTSQVSYDENPSAKVRPVR